MRRWETISRMTAGVLHAWSGSVSAPDRNPAIARLETCWPAPAGAGRARCSPACSRWAWDEAPPATNAKADVCSVIANATSEESPDLMSHARLRVARSDSGGSACTGICPRCGAMAASTSLVSSIVIRGRRSARRRGGYRRFHCGDDLRTVPWLDEIDAVVVATTPFTHYRPDPRGARRRGKHVLTEKPFAMTVAEGQELVALSRANGAALAIVHNFQFARVDATAHARHRTGRARERPWRGRAAVRQPGAPAAEVVRGAAPRAVLRRESAPAVLAASALAGPAADAGLRRLSEHVRQSHSGDHPGAIRERRPARRPHPGHAVAAFREPDQRVARHRPRRSRAWRRRRVPGHLPAAAQRRRARHAVGPPDVARRRPGVTGVSM